MSESEGKRSRIIPQKEEDQEGWLIVVVEEEVESADQHSLEVVRMSWRDDGLPPAD